MHADILIKGCVLLISCPKKRTTLICYDFEMKDIYYNTSGYMLHMELDE